MKLFGSIQMNNKKPTKSEKRKSGVNLLPSNKSSNQEKKRRKIIHYPFVILWLVSLFSPFFTVYSFSFHFGESVRKILPKNIHHHISFFVQSNKPDCMQNASVALFLLRSILSIIHFLRFLSNDVVFYGFIKSLR